MVKYTNSFLRKLEELFGETPYVLRYEKGNFKSGYCVLKDTKIVIVNKYFPLEGRINALVEILRSLEVEPKVLTEKSRKLYNSILQNNIEFQQAK